MIDPISDPSMPPEKKKRKEKEKRSRLSNLYKSCYFFFREESQSYFTPRSGVKDRDSECVDVEKGKGKRRIEPNECVEPL